MASRHRKTSKTYYHPSKIAIVIGHCCLWNSLSSCITFLQATIGELHELVYKIKAVEETEKEEFHMRNWLEMVAVMEGWCPRTRYLKFSVDGLSFSNDLLRRQREKSVLFFI
ncbi:hypothetical protein E2542_SST20880 [Spatholobus suberectus]|nr:hypothetical protein E2542_SST20880 [Spatholobus suberectus]